jgi:hypothetical protein
MNPASNLSKLSALYEEMHTDSIIDNDNLATSLLWLALKANSYYACKYLMENHNAELDATTDFSFYLTGSTGKRIVNMDVWDPSVEETVQLFLIHEVAVNQAVCSKVMDLCPYFAYTIGLFHKTQEVQTINDYAARFLDISNFEQRTFFQWKQYYIAHRIPIEAHQNTMTSKAGTLSMRLVIDNKQGMCYFQNDRIVVDWDLPLTVPHTKAYLKAPVICMKSTLATEKDAERIFWMFVDAQTNQVDFLEVYNSIIVPAGNVELLTALRKNQMDGALRHMVLEYMLQSMYTPPAGATYKLMEAPVSVQQWMATI